MPNNSSLENSEELKILEKNSNKMEIYLRVIISLFAFLIILILIILSLFIYPRAKNNLPSSEEPYSQADMELIDCLESPTYGCDVLFSNSDAETTCEKINSKDVELIDSCFNYIAQIQQDSTVCEKINNLEDRENCKLSLSSLLGGLDYEQIQI